ncbi:MAG: hypothetical protein SF028_09745 [Candidatus Sumerlaeia bacterium]|nr:hypothetical protein [Candidatus Sumerlaeia bacterium]
MTSWTRLVSPLVAALLAIAVLSGCGSVPKGTPGTLLVYVEESNGTGVNNAFLSTVPQIPPGTVRDDVVPGLLLPPPISEGPLTTISYTAPEWQASASHWLTKVYGPKETSVVRGKERKVTLRPANPGRIEVVVVGPNWNPSSFSGVLYVTAVPFNPASHALPGAADPPLVYAELPFQGSRKFRIENLPTGSMYLSALTKDAEGRADMVALGQINVSSGRVFDTTLQLNPIVDRATQ